MLPVNPPVFKLNCILSEDPFITTFKSIPKQFTAQLLELGVEEACYLPKLNLIEY